MISKEDLTLQYQNMQQQIEKLKEEQLHLQQLKTEKEKTIEELNKKNKRIIEEELPSALNTDKTTPKQVEHFNSEKKQDVLDYIEERLNTLSSDKEHNEALLDQSTKWNSLLDQVQEHLATGYKKNTLADLTNKSGVRSTHNTKNTGFDLLLELLGEEPRKYTWTRDSTDRHNLLSVVPQKIKSAAFTVGVDTQTVREVTASLEALGKIKTKLVDNYAQHDKTSEEVVELEEQITQIETEAIKELTTQAEALDRQIKELEQKEDENQKQVEERQNKERQAQERQREDLRQKAAQEKKERRTLAVELKKLLTTYVEDRNQHYYAKDFVLPADKKNRNRFIDKIVNPKNGLLNQYVKSGNSRELLTTITAEITSFHGIKMQALLNRIVVKLIEAESKQVMIAVRSEKASQVLSSFKNRKGKYEEYALKMENLYNKIDAMQVYAETLPAQKKKIIAQLIQALKKDVDQFVCQNAHQFPANESFKKFKMTIQARLHSHDDMMSGQTSWPDTILNVLLCVITIGKLLYSKATAKRAILFFDKTEDQKEVEAPVDAALENLGNFLTNS